MPFTGKISSSELMKCEMDILLQLKTRESTEEGRKSLNRDTVMDRLVQYRWQSLADLCHVNNDLNKSFAALTAELLRGEPLLGKYH